MNELLSNELVMALSDTFFDKFKPDAHGSTQVTSNIGLEGPNYDYLYAIKTPMELKVSGNPAGMKTNINAMMAYGDLLFMGGGEAAYDKRPLGSRFFYKSGGMCKAPNGQSVQRSTYIDNIPGSYSRRSAEQQAKDGAVGRAGLKGLVPGIFEDVTKLNPFGIIYAIMEKAQPACREVSLNVVLAPPAEGADPTFESQFLADNEIKYLSPCVFEDKTNPITGANCSEGFVGEMKNKVHMRLKEKISDDKLIQIYIGSLSILGLFILLRLLKAI